MIKRHVPTFFELLFTLLVVMAVFPLALFTTVVVFPIGLLRSLIQTWRLRPVAVLCRSCGHSEDDHDGYGGLCDGAYGPGSRTACGCLKFRRDSFAAGV